jgi:hypothetical protein
MAYPGIDTGSLSLNDTAIVRAAQQSSLRSHAAVTPRHTHRARWGGKFILPPEIAVFFALAGGRVYTPHKAGA